MWDHQEPISLNYFPNDSLWSLHGGKSGNGISHGPQIYCRGYQDYSLHQAKYYIIEPICAATCCWWNGIHGGQLFMQFDGQSVVAYLLDIDLLSQGDDFCPYVKSWLCVFFSCSHCKAVLPQLSATHLTHCFWTSGIKGMSIIYPFPNILNKSAPFLKLNLEPLPDSFTEHPNLWWWSIWPPLKVVSRLGISSSSNPCFCLTFFCTPSIIPFISHGLAVCCIKSIKIWVDIYYSKRWCQATSWAV